jgi:hypothetical protein
MTKALLATIKAEYQHTEPTLSRKEHIKLLCEKYNCDTKDLKGYTTWEKGLNLESKIKLVYETIFVPQIELEPDNEDKALEISETADKIIKGEIVSNPTQTKATKDGFEGLRLLDTKLQKQALELLQAIDECISIIESAKDIKDLVSAHTSIRDSYFNTQAPMINIINGNVDNSSTQNELTVLLDNTEDDC